MYLTHPLPPGLTLCVLRGKATFALVNGKKDSPEGTKAKLQIEGRAPTAIAVGAVVKFDPCCNRHHKKCHSLKFSVYSM
jgi:hypothetical protein